MTRERYNSISERLAANQRMRVLATRIFAKTVELYARDPEQGRAFNNAQCARWVLMYGTSPASVYNAFLRG